MTLPPPEYDDPAPLSQRPGPIQRGLPAQLALLGVALLLNFLIAVGVIAAVPQFGDVFESFGAELPIATRLVVQLYPLVGALPLLPVVAWFAWPQHQLRGLAALLTSLACVLLVPLLVGYALYLPILRLDSLAH